MVIAEGRTSASNLQLSDQNTPASPFRPGRPSGQDGLGFQEEKGDVSNVSNSAASSRSSGSFFKEGGCDAGLRPLNSVYCSAAKERPDTQHQHHLPDMVI